MVCSRLWRRPVERVLVPAVRHPCPWPAIVREERTTSYPAKGSRSQCSPRTTPLRRPRCRGQFCRHSHNRAKTDESLLHINDL